MLLKIALGFDMKGTGSLGEESWKAKFVSITLRIFTGLGIAKLLQNNIRF